MFYRLIAVVIAILISWLAHISFLRWFVWFFRMMVHELGHSVSGWLGSRFMFPVPFFATTGNPIFIFLCFFAVFILIMLSFQMQQKWLRYFAFALIPFFASYFAHGRSILLYIYFLAIFLFIIQYAFFRAKVFFMLIGLLLVALQYKLTWGLSDGEWDMIMRFSGIAGEFVISSICISLFFYNISESPFWTIGRYMLLFFGMLVFVSSSIEWLSYDSSSQLPFGTLFGGTDDNVGDLNMLRDKYGWSVELIISRYQELAKYSIAFMSLAAIISIFVNKKAPDEELVRQ